MSKYSVKFSILGQFFISCGIVYNITLLPLTWIGIDIVLLDFTTRVFLKYPLDMITITWLKVYECILYAMIEMLSEYILGQFNSDIYDMLHAFGGISWFVYLINEKLKFNMKCRIYLVLNKISFNFKLRVKIILNGCIYVNA